MTMRPVLQALTAILMTTAILAAAPVEAAPPEPTGAPGNWINPHNSVKVEIVEHDGLLNGKVVWASAEAEQDARIAGTANLVGTQLLQDYRQVGDNRFQGRVFVPDMNRTFYSTIEQQGPDALKISGCILGGLICKSQTWHRG